MATLLPPGKQSYSDSAGLPLAGGKLYTYESGTTTPKATYSDAAGTVPNTNPVVLDARGEAVVFWSGSYTVVLKTVADATVWTVDGIASPAEAASVAAISADIADIASTAPGKGAALVGYKLSAVGSAARTAADKLDTWILATDIDGVDPTGATSSGAAIAGYMASLSNSVLTTAFSKGGVEIFFPPGVYVIDRPIVFKTVNTTIRGIPGATIFQATSGTFLNDSGAAALGKWMIIQDSSYNALGVDLYNCHIKGIVIDLNNRTDVGGIVVNGGRNTSSVQDVQWIRFHSNLLKLGKSPIGVHSVTQGFFVSNSFAIWDGNPGQHTVNPDGTYFVLDQANECTFLNVMIVTSSGVESVGTGFLVGAGTYQCGGNRFISCGGSNFKAAHITVASSAGFVVGENVTCSNGFRGTISAVSSGLIKCRLRDGAVSAYAPKDGDTITGDTSTATTTITSSDFGVVFHLRNSFGTVISSPTAIENSVCGVLMDFPGSAAACAQNVVDGGRLYNFTASCMVTFKNCTNNRATIETYASPSQILTGATGTTINYYGVLTAGQSLVDLQSVATSNAVYEYLTSGQINIKNTGKSAVVSVNSGGQGFRATEFYSELFAGTAARIRIENDGDIYLDSAAGKTVGLRENGVLKVLLDGSGRVRVFGLTTTVPAVADSLYKDALGFVKIT